jgi:hypothetical protein
MNAMEIQKLEAEIDRLVAEVEWRDKRIAALDDGWARCADTVAEIANERNEAEAKLEIAELSASRLFEFAKDVVCTLDDGQDGRAPYSDNSPEYRVLSMARSVVDEFSAPRNARAEKRDTN